MPHPGKLRTRILLAFLGLGSAFSLLLGVFVFVSYEAGQENTAQRLLMAEIEDYLERRQVDPAAAPPDAPWLKTVVGKEQLPPPYRDRLADFELENDIGLPLLELNEAQLWQGPGPSPEENLFVLLEPATEAAVWRNPNLLRSTLGILALVLGITFWLAFFLSRRLAEPLAELARRAGDYNPTRPTLGPIPAGSDLEVEQIWGAFLALESRVERFVERERELSRFASHELRTPVTIISGSADVLRRALPEPPPKVQRALTRIEGATREMGATITTILWLVREESDPHIDPICESGRLVQAEIAAHRPLLAGKPVEVLLELEAETHADLPSELFRISASNLIRNAFQYTREGQVHIRLGPTALIVEDTGIGIRAELLNRIRQPFVRGEEGEGTGIGLTLVDRIAARCGWQFVINSELGSGTRAELHLGHAPP